MTEPTDLDNLTFEPLVLDEDRPIRAFIYERRTYTRWRLLFWAVVPLRRWGWWRRQFRPPLVGVVMSRDA